MRFNLPAWRPALALFIVFATGCTSQAGHPLGPGSIPSRKPELHQAVDAKDGKRVRDLLASGADVNIKGITGETALHHAVWAGNLSFAGLLLSAGANPNTRDITGSTPLSSAEMDGNVEMVTLLVTQGSNVNDPHADGEYGMETPLHWAVMRGHIPVARFLIEHGTDIRARNGAGFRLLSRFIEVFQGSGGGYSACRAADPIPSTVDVLYFFSPFTHNTS